MASLFEVFVRTSCRYTLLIIIIYAFVAELWIITDILMVTYRKGKDLLFGCIAGTLMCTYKYNVTGAGILGYRFDEARKEREARKQREEADKNNIDISFC